MNKLIRDGKVAVIVHADYGSGWSTACYPEERQARLFDAEMAEAVEEAEQTGDYTQAEALANRKWPGGYNGNVSRLVVEWLPVGTRFRITEYDGNECVEVLDLNSYMEA